MDAAQWVFQISVLTCIVNLISIPYNSLIVAHEKIDVYKRQQERQLVSISRQQEIKAGLYLMLLQ